MFRLGTVVLAMLAAALAVPAAFAGAGQWQVSGSGIGSGAVAGDHLELGTTSDVGGANLTGHAQDQFTLGSTQFNSGGSIVCLTVSDNRAIVLFKLAQPISVPELPGEVFRYGAAYLEDNGNPVGGQSPDRMVDFAVREQNVHFFCDNPSFDFFAAEAEPLASGNFVVKGG
jgi:hypothetical protein